MSRREREDSSLDGGMLIWGIVYGVIIGGITALLTLPKSGRALRREVSEGMQNAGQQLRSTVESAVPSDPVAESLAEGKAAARRRREELGLSR